MYSRAKYLRRLMSSFLSLILVISNLSLVSAEPLSVNTLSDNESVITEDIQDIPSVEDVPPIEDNLVDEPQSIGTDVPVDPEIITEDISVNKTKVQKKVNVTVNYYKDDELFDTQVITVSSNSEFKPKFKILEDYHIEDITPFNIGSEDMVIDIKYLRNVYSLSINGIKDKADVFVNDILYDSLSENKYAWGTKLNVRLDLFDDYELKEITDESGVVHDLDEMILMPTHDFGLSFNIVKKKISENMISKNQANQEPVSVSKDEVSADEAVSEDEVKDEVSADEAVSEDVTSDNISDNISDNNIVVSENMSDIATVSNDMDSTILSKNEISASGNTPSENKPAIAEEYIVEPSTTESLILVKGQASQLIPIDTWTTSDKKIVTVNKKGKIVGKKEGTATITRTGALNTTYTVTVTARKSGDKYLSGTTVKLERGKSLELAKKDVWTTSDKKVVALKGKTGAITAKKGGTATVTVTGTHNRTYNITVEEPTITKKRKKITINVGQTDSIANDLGGTTLPILYQSLNTHVATVDEYGTITALKVGSTKINAIVNNKKYVFTVKVVNNGVDGGAVNATHVYLQPKKSFALNVKFPRGVKAKDYTIEYNMTGNDVTETTKGKTITYADSVASVTNKGKIKAIADGTTYVNVLINGEVKYKVEVVVEGEGDKVQLPTQLELNIGDSYQIDTSSIKQGLIWKSNKAKVATVNNYAIITGVAKGNAVISTKISGKNYKIKVKVVNDGAPEYTVEDSVIKKELIQAADETNPAIYRFITKLGKTYTKSYYNITINYNGGTAENVGTYCPEDGDIVLNNPTRSDYVFNGWSGKSGVIKSGTKGHLTFDASWTHINGRINLDIDGDGNKDAEVLINDGGKVIGELPKDKDGNKISKITVEDKDGNKQIVDIENEQVTPEILSNISSNTTPKPSTIEERKTYGKTYTVSFDSAGGSTVAAQTLRDGESITKDIPTKENCTFEGWTLNGNRFDFGTLVYANITLVATWKTSNAVVKIKDKDGNEKEIPISEGEKTNPDYFEEPKEKDDYVYPDENENETLEDYDFKGYYYKDKDGEEKKYNPETDVLSNNTVLYPKYSVEYDIVYDLNDADNENKASLSEASVRKYIKEDETFTLPIPTRTGYTFTGWTGANGSTAQTSVSITKGSTGNKSYKANWTVTTYTITYNLNSGTNASSNPTSYNIESSTITLAAPTRDGYTFLGWTGSNGTTAQTSVTIAKGSTGNKTYTANWKSNVTLEVGTKNSWGARYITKIRVYNSSTTYTDYTNPSVGTLWIPTLDVTPGQKVVFYHKSYSAIWDYDDKGSNYQFLGYALAVYFTVPSSASGDATLSLFSDKDTARFSYYNNNTTGWVKDCYPALVQ
ncbi:MAG: InlB B-repeat-containing protein [Lachnospiraceae bacterium]|nr:InlB B-repeat-containing protein [Lachnospiraceae bacterium]